MVRHVREAIVSERGSHDCGLDCSAMTDETRLGADREASGEARSVRWLRRRNGAVTFLKTANGRMETRRSTFLTSRTMWTFFRLHMMSSWRKTEMLVGFLGFVGGNRSRCRRA